LKSVVYASNDHFIGEVTSDRVNVRAGHGLNYEVVCQLSEKDKVEVYERIKDWYRIKPPQKIYVWVSKGFIQDGKVTCKRLNIRSGPGLAYSILGQLEKDNSVDILETKDEWIKLAAPEHIFFWVNEKYVKYISSQKDYGDYLDKRKEAKEALTTADNFFNKEIEENFPKIEFSRIYKLYQKIIENYPKTEFSQTALKRITDVEKKEEAIYREWKKSASLYGCRGVLSRLRDRRWCLRGGFLGAKVICYLRFERGYKMLHGKGNKVYIKGRIVFYDKSRRRPVPVIIVEEMRSI
jgi:SH3-like domain-containing protein